MKLCLPLNFRTDSLGCRLDGAIEILLGSLLAAMPFALGVVAPWSEAVAVGVVALIALLLAVRAALTSGLDPTPVWALIPIVLFIGLAAAQMLPLPASFVGAVSPHTLATRSQLLGDLPGAAGVLGRITLSFYPAATSHDLRTVLVCTVVFLAATRVLCREQQYVRLLWAVTLSGAAAAVLALLQDLSGSGKIYWLFDSGHPVATGGPFVSYSNYSQYINLCTGAALGLLLHTLRRDNIIPAEGSTVVQKPKAGWQMRELKSWHAWPPLVVAGLGCVTLCLSLSRGGMLSLMCAAGLTVLMLARRRGMRGAAWILALLLLSAFVCLLYVGFDLVCDRLATLKNAPDPSAGRIQTFKDILVAWRQFPLFGTGLGTHEYIYPMFDRSSDPGLAEYADSDWFQALEEMGVVGLALVLSFAGYVWFCYAKAIRRGRPRLNVIAYGLGFGLLAVMLQSMTDFGQHLPAIGCISALFCAMLVNLSRAGRRDGATAVERRPISGGPRGEAGLNAVGPGWHLPRLALPTVMAVAMVWAAIGANAARRSQAADDRALAIAERLEEFDWAGTGPDFAQLIGEARDAVAADPSNVKARYTLACYRWRAVSRGAENGPASDNLADENRADGRPPADASPLPAPVEAEQVIRDLDAARMACPTYGPAYAVAGQIERMALNRAVGSAHVRTAYALAPAHPEVCLAAAQLDAAEGKFDSSLRKARRCLTLDGSFLSQVIGLYLHEVDRPDLAVAVVGDDPERLFRLYDELRDESEQSDRPGITAAMAAARVIIKSTCDRADAPAWTMASLGSLLREEKDYPRAIACYHRALQKQYGQVDWRVSLAGLLLEAGQNDEAVHQAEICLHLQPQMKAALKVIDDANMRPGVVDAHGSASIGAEPN